MVSFFIFVFLLKIIKMSQKMILMKNVIIIPHQTIVQYYYDLKYRIL